MEAVMLRSLAIVVFAVVIILFPSASIPAAEFGTADEAKAMLDRAVAAVKEDETKALDMFNKGQGGFKDRDLYVFCANASDDIVTAHPYGNKGRQLKEIFGKKGYPLGQEIMEKATEGTIKEVTYWWPRPGSDSHLPADRVRVAFPSAKAWSIELPLCLCLQEDVQKNGNSGVNYLPGETRCCPARVWFGSLADIR